MNMVFYQEDEGYATNRATLLGFSNSGSIKYNHQTRCGQDYFYSFIDLWPSSRIFEGLQFLNI